ncbi:ribonuclease H-like domain-containing protein [Tanacetum coccineum]
MIDYALWEVIENGATLPKTVVVKGVEKVMPITSAEDKAQRRLEVKARSSLIMGIPNEHQLKFNSIKDAKLLLKVVEKRFDEKLSQEDVNQTLLRSLSPEWNTHAVVWRNKAHLDTMSMDDLYNNLKVYEPEVKGMSSSSSSTQNMTFVSSSNNNTSSTNEAVNTAHGVSTASTHVNAANFTNIDNLSDTVIYDMEEMDLRWQMAMLTMRARRFLKNIGRMLTVNGNETISFDKSKVECYNCHKRGHFAMECRAHVDAPRNQDNKTRKDTKRSCCPSRNIYTSTSLCHVMYSQADMTWNMSYLTNYEEIDGGYVAFGGNPKGGKITGKCTIKTGNLDFENVYFVRELKFNLFSVSQMCDKKNSVRFNDTGCIVLSPNFKLIDESQILLRVPRKNNMYSVDLKNIVPKGGLTCLFAKATSDESKIWHRRLVEENLHIRFSENTPNAVDPKSSHVDGSKLSSDNGKRVNEDPRKESECNDQEKEDNVNSTNKS